MRVVLNVIWFVLAGVWMAIGYAIAALLMFILIITIPLAQRSETYCGSCSPAGG